MPSDLHAALTELGLQELEVVFEREAVSLLHVLQLSNPDFEFLGVQRVADRVRLRELARNAKDAAAELDLDGRTRVAASPAVDPDLDGRTRVARAPSSPRVDLLSGDTRPGRHAVSPYASLALPAEIQSYRILEVLGVGSFGMVVRARHADERTAASQGGDVAIRLLNANVDHDRERANAYLAAVRRLQGVRIPALVRVFDVLEAAEWRGAVMARVSGAPLTARILQAQRPLAETCELIAPIADALDHLHALGLAHHALRPENVLCCADGATVLLDPGPGFAAASGEAVVWAAPEQLNGEVDGPGADRYALGLITYALLGAGMPWEPGSSDARVAQRKLDGDLLPLSRLGTSLPAGCVHAVTRMLARDPAHRFGAAVSFVDALREADWAANATDWAEDAKNVLMAPEDVNVGGVAAFDSEETRVAAVVPPQPPAPASPAPRAAAPPASAGRPVTPTPPPGPPSAAPASLAPRAAAPPAPPATAGHPMTPAPPPAPPAAASPAARAASESGARPSPPKPPPPSPRVPVAPAGGTPDAVPLPPTRRPGSAGRRAQPRPESGSTTPMSPPVAVLASTDVPDISEALVEEPRVEDAASPLAPEWMSPAPAPASPTPPRVGCGVLVAAIGVLLVGCAGVWSFIEGRRAAASFDLAHADDLHDETVPRFTKVRVSGYDGDPGAVSVGSSCRVVEALRLVRRDGSATYYAGRLDCDGEVDLQAVSVALVEAAPTAAWTVGARVRLVDIEAPADLAARRPDLLGRACTLRTVPVAADATGSVWSFTAECETADGASSMTFERGVVDAPVEPRPDRDAILLPPLRVASFASPTPELPYRFDVALTELTASQVAISGPPEQPLVLSWPEAAALANALSVAQGLEQCYVPAVATNSASATPVATFDWPRGVFCQGWRVPSVAEFTWLAFGLDGVAAWTVAEGRGVTHRVALLSPDAHGLHDVHGNRAEWVWSATSPSSPRMPVDARGGSVDDDAPVTMLPRAALRLVRTSGTIPEDTCSIVAPFPNYGGIRAGQTAYVRETGVAVLVLSLDGAGPDGCGSATVQAAGGSPVSASTRSLSSSPVYASPDAEPSGLPDDAPSHTPENAAEARDEMSPEERCSISSACNDAVRAIAKMCQRRIESETGEPVVGSRWQVRYRAGLLGGRPRVQVVSAGEPEPAFERCLMDALTDAPWRPASLVTVNIAL